MIRRLEEDDDITQALARDRLGLPAVLFFVMSAAAPLTVVAGVLTTGYAVTGNVGLPSACKQSDPPVSCSVLVLAFGF
jgi:hypothetical protein